MLRSFSILFGVISSWELIEIWTIQPFVVVDLFFDEKSWEIPSLCLFAGGNSWHNDSKTGSCNPGNVFKRGDDKIY